MNANATLAAPPADRPRVVPFGPTVLVLALTAMLAIGQLYVVIPLFTAMAGDWGTTPDAITWTTTAFGLAYAVGFLVTGPLADRFGPRRVMLTGLTATVVATVAVATAPDLATATALRALQGLTTAAFAPSALSYIATHIDPGRRAAAFTWVTSSFLAAGVAGQAFGQAISDPLGWRAVFVVSAVLLVAGIAGLRAVLLPDQVSGAAATRPVAAFARLLRNSRLVLLYAASATLMLAFVAVYTALQLSGPESLRENPEALLGLRASALPAMLAVPLLIPWLAARVATVHRVAFGLLGAAAATVTAGTAGSAVVTLAVLLMVFVAGIAIAAPGLVELVGSQAGNARASGIGLYGFFLFVGASVGPQLASGLAGGGFAAVSVWVAAALGAGALLTFVSARAGTRARTRTRQPARS